MTRTSPIGRVFRLSALSALAGIASILGGCVSAEQYTAMKLSRDEAVSQLSAAQQQASTASAQYDVLKRQLEAINGAGQGKEALLTNQATTIADLQHQLQDANERYQNALALAAKAGATPLPAPLTNELTELAQQNPGMVDFDPNTGMIKFKSDVTFSPGSAEVTDSVKPVIDRVAQILDGPIAKQYSLVVVGHTDNQLVSNPATIRNGHKDNWYLSVHRAIGVSKELQKQGIAPARIEVAGYADQRPLVPNDSEANKAKNRRVEILIQPTTTAHSSGVAEAPSATAVPASDRTSGRPAFNKDSPAAPHVPDSNK